MTRRALRPRPHVLVRPSFVSNETVHAIAGIVPRKFIEVVVPECREVTRLGHTVMVPIDEFERVIRELGQGPDDGQDAATEGRDDDQPRSVDDVLRRINRELAR